MTRFRIPRRSGAAPAALTLALVGVLVLLGLAGPARAADDDVTWGISPATSEGIDSRSRFDYQVDPGTTITDRVAVTNHSAQKATFRIYATDATTDYDTAAFALLGADQAPTGLGSWTAVDGKAAKCPDSNDDAEASCAAGLGATVDLEPGNRAVLPVEITVPANATPGDYSAAIVASHASQAQDGEGSPVRVEQRVGTRVYLRVAGDLAPAVTMTGVVSGFSTGWNPFGSGTASVGFDLANTGNVRLSATPSVRLTAPFGIDLGTHELAPVEDLLPGGTGHVTGTVEGVPPLLLAFSDITVTPDAGGLDAEPLAASTRAWAIPWSLLGLVVVVVGVPWAVIAWRRRSRRLLGQELADYAEQVRAEALATTAGGGAGEGQAGTGLELLTAPVPPSCPQGRRTGRRTPRWIRARREPRRRTAPAPAPTQPIREVVP